MAILHDPSVRSSIEQRLAALSPDTRSRWGKMSVDQMLWHVNQAMGVPLGETTLAPVRPPLPRSVIKFMVLRMPWVKGAPTNPAFVPKRQYDFEAERARCRLLIGKLTARPIDGDWPVHPIFGRMSGNDVSKLQAKHLDHHLRQFGV
jgi:Protein of unknown function (DUF1569)